MSTVYGWEAEEAVRGARRAQEDATSTYDAQLTQLLEEYAGRRTAAAELVRKVATIAVGHAAEADRRAQQLVETLTSRHAGVVERLERERDTYRDRTRQLEEVLSEKRRLVEDREQTGEEVQVSIGRSLGGWQVADLEEVAYRLRCGGAVDETPVKVTEWKASALVPAPNLVPLTRPTREPEHTEGSRVIEAPEPAPAPRWWRQRWRPMLAAAGLVLLLLEVWSR